MGTPYGNLLGKGTLWAVKEFGPVSVKDIADITGWSSKSVYDELRRVCDYTLLGMWIRKRNNNGKVVYEMDPEARLIPMEKMADIVRNTFDFGVDKQFKRVGGRNENEQRRED